MNIEFEIVDEFAWRMTEFPNTIQRTRSLPAYSGSALLNVLLCWVYILRFAKLVRGGTGAFKFLVFGDNFRYSLSDNRA